MTQINTKMNYYQARPNFKASPAMPYLPDMEEYNVLNPAVSQNTAENAAAPAVQLPDIYYSPNSFKKEQSFTEKLKKADIMEIITPWFEHPLMMLGTCFGISYGVDAFSKSCNKEYDKSILSRAAKFGDKIEKSDAIQSKPAQNVLRWIKTGGSKVKNFAMKSDVIRAMVETPSRPENASPKNELLNTEARAVEKFKEIVNQLGLIGEEGGKLNIKRLHLNKDVIKGLESDFGVQKLSDVAEEKVVSRYLLKQSGLFNEAEMKSVIEGSNPVTTALSKITEKIGGAEKLKLYAEDSTGAYRKEILKICEQLNGISINQGTDFGGKLKKPLLPNQTGFQDVYNRIHSITDGAKTETGKFMSKFLQKIHRGFTFGGAKAGVMLFVAPMIVKTLLNTGKADKDEKVGTFAHGMVEAVSWVFTFPLILMGIHAVGGIQYAGMGKEKVEQLRNKVAKFNKRVENGEFTSHAQWKEAKKQVSKEIADLRKVENQNFVTRCLRKISKFGKSDLLKLERYKDKNVIKNVRNLPAWLKNFTWSFGRFAVFMVVGIPIVDKIITKCMNKVFGHHYDDMIEKDNLAEKETQKEFLHDDLQERMYKAQAKKMGLIPPEAEPQAAEAEAEVLPPVMPEAIQAESTQPEVKPLPVIQNTSATVQNPVHQQIETVKRDNYNYIPSQDSVLRKAVPVQVNKYVPSQMAANVGKVFDNSGLEAALRRADRAEDRAIQTLAGKFPN